MKKLAPLISVFLSGCLWGLMGFFQRRMTAMGFSSGGIVFIRCASAAVMFALLALATDPKAFAVRPRDFWCFFGTGILSLLFFTSCYFRAMSLMTLSAAAILLYTSPVFVILISAAVFRDRITGRKILAMLLAFAGCCLVSGIAGGNMKISTVGLLYGLGSGIGYALYSIFGKLAMQRGYSSITVNLYSCALAALGSGLIWGFSEPVAITFSSAPMALFCLCAGIVTCFLPYLLYTFGLSKIDAGRASIIVSVEPVVATLVGIAAFGESMDVWAAAGIILVLSGIVICSRSEKER